MKKQWRRWLGMAGVAGSLGLGTLATAQSTGFQPFKGLFGSQAAAPDAKGHATERLTEIQVELAWLSDPLTFPYYLEAHVKGQALEIRGYVANAAARSQALNLAKLNSPMAIVDALKEHASLVNPPTRRAPEEIKSAAQMALREAFPRQRLTVQCRKDGNVEISGTVRTLEQKLAVSQAMRRLHGCTSVTNTTQVENGQGAPQPVVTAATPDNSSVATADASSTPVPVKTAPDKTAPEPKRGGIFAMFARTPPPTKAPTSNKTAASEASTTNIQTVAAGPSQTQLPPSAVEPAKDSRASKAPPAKTAVASANAAPLKKRIETAVPNVRNVLVTFTSKTDVRIQCTAGPSDDSATVAGQILSLRELEPFKVDLQIQVPEKK